MNGRAEKEAIPGEEIPNEQPEAWIDPTDIYYLQRINATTGGRVDTIVRELTGVTDRRLRQPFTTKAYDGLNTVTDLPVSPNDYENAEFSVAKHPRTQQGVQYYSGVFGYDISGEPRRIGPFNFIQLDEKGHVTEMGFGSDLVREYFDYHLYGREFTESDRQRIQEIQEAVFSYLRNDEQAKKLLKEFAQSRGWPEGLEEVASLAYYHPLVTPLEEWANRQGFSADEMYRAGWYDISFTRDGKPNYSTRDAHVIRIPYFNEQGKIDVWRTRNLNPRKAQNRKYTSWPLDRSVERDYTVNEKLYNGWHLPDAVGKPIIITEGEFKCLVTQELTKVLTVGIPGITEVDETILTALAQANASEYIVVLDRDPQGKAMMRVDSITDSERAAYAIALQLKERGAQNVRIGRLPDIFQGKKVGIDDYLLSEGPEAIDELIGNARQPEAYAEEIGLNPVFFALFKDRQRLRKSIEQYELSVKRGGPTVSDDLYQEALSLRDSLEEIYADFLINRYRGATRINQPSREIRTLYRSSKIKDAHRKIAVTEDGKGIDISKFANDILFFSFYPDDTPTENRWIGEADLQVPFSQADIRRYQNGEEIPRLSQFEQFGREALGERKPNETIKDIPTILLAGYLSTQFPTDEYEYEMDLRFFIDRASHWEQHVQIPISIFRKTSGEAVAFATLLTWGEGDDIEAAAMRNKRNVNLSVTYLRKGDTEFKADKYDAVLETLWPYWHERTKDSTNSLMSRFGISPETVDQARLVTLSPENYRELKQHFVHRRLLNQATNAGLYRWGENAMIGERFSGDVVIFPVISGNRIIAMRVLPLNIGDHTPPALDPNLKLVRHLDGEGRHLTTNFDPDRNLYLGDRLRGVRGKRLTVTFNELDALVLAPTVNHVVGLNSSFELSDEVANRIASSSPSEINIVLTGHTPQSQYDDFDFDGIPGYIKDMVDFRDRIQRFYVAEDRELHLEITVLPSPLTSIAGEARGLSAERADTISQIAVDLDRYLKVYKYNGSTHDIERRFLNARQKVFDYLEITAIPDLVDGRPITAWVKDVKRYYEALRTQAINQFGLELPTLDEYISRKLNLDDTTTFEDLIHSRQEDQVSVIYKPLYALDSDSQQDTVPGSFADYFESVVNPQQDRKGIVNTLREVRPDPQERTRTVKGPSQQEKKPPFVHDNPKGRVIDVHQRYPHFVGPPEVTITEAGNQRFEATVTLPLFIEGSQITANVVAGSKREAETLAFAEISSQLERKTFTRSSDIKKAEGNPKVAVFHVMQREDKNTPEPESVVRQTSRGIEVDVTLLYKGEVYAGHGRGKNKKIAEKAAYSQIYAKMTGLADAAEVSEEEQIPDEMPGDQPSTRLQRALDQALHMEEGDRNYIGKLQQISNLTKAKLPDFVDRRYDSREFIVWESSLVLVIDGKEFTSLQYGDSRKEARQNAARDILFQIYDFIQGEEEDLELENIED